VSDSRKIKGLDNYLFYQVLMDEATPNDLREIVAKQGRVFQNTLRQLIIEGQATGEVASLVGSCWRSAPLLFLLSGEVSSSSTGVW
jgi:hypothetical protein